ncbi:MAG: DUF378 domain-containing protein [Candidatus Kaiserbacteria bacterium]|nr:DUF378 domain-containing protein [Candidatus Kaiserbacteria bacterium]
MKVLHSIAFVLVIVGGLNWGLIALGSYLGGSWNIVNLILGSWPAVEILVYLLVGVSAILLVFTHKNDCRYCATEGAGM